MPVTEVSVHPRGERRDRDSHRGAARRGARARGRGWPPRRGSLREVVAELRKVLWPSRNELRHLHRSS